MQFPHKLFKQAGLNSTDVANLCGVSRITGYRWLLGVGRNGAPGVGVNIFLEDRVNKVTAPIAAAVAAGVLPDAELSKLAPTKRATRIKSIIHQFRVKK